MPSGSTSVVGQCSLKDKRRRLVRQHATEEEHDTPSEKNERESKVINVSEEIVEQTIKVPSNHATHSDIQAGTRLRVEDKNGDNISSFNETLHIKNKFSIHESPQTCNQNSVCVANSIRRSSYQTTASFTTPGGNHTSSNQLCGKLSINDPLESSNNVSITQQSNNKTSNHTRVTIPEGNQRTSNSKRSRPSRSDNQRASGSVTIRTSNVNKDSNMHRTSNQTRERTRRTSIQTNGSISMLESNQRTNHSSKESLLTVECNQRTQNSRRGSILPINSKMITCNQASGVASPLDNKPRTRNSSRGSIFGQEDNLLHCDQPSDAISASSLHRIARHSSRGSICTLDVSPRALPEVGRITSSISRESVCMPKISRQSSAQGHHWKRNSSCGSISTSTLSVSGKTNSLDIAGQREIWELQSRLSNPSPSTSQQKGQLVTGDTLDKGQHCCLIQ